MKRLSVRLAALFLCLLTLAGTCSISASADNNAGDRAGTASGFQVYTEGSMPLESTEGFKAAEKKEYTLMVYMIGSNLESSSGCASADIEEMKAAGADYDKCNVILYTGGSSRWHGRIPSSKNCVIDLSRPEGEQIVAATKKNTDMGEAETLAEFLNFACSNYPAEHFSLIFWDHGGGPVYGFGCDDLFYRDSLGIDEMYFAMEQTPFKEHKLDFVGFDACLMANVECMAVWSDYARFYLASQELEPGDGWDYGFLSELHTASGPEELCSGIIKRYAEYYELKKTERFNPGVTLSLVSLEHIPQLTSALGELAEKAESGVYDVSSYQTLQKSRAGFKSMGLADGNESGSYQYDIVDMGDMARELSAVYPEQAGALLSAIDSCITDSYSNIGRCCGISVYYPFANKPLYSDNRDFYRSICPSGQYNDYISRLSQRWLSSPAEDFELGTPRLDGSEYCLQLSPEQLACCTGASYTVLSQMEGHDYFMVPLLSNARILPDESGMLRVAANPEIVHLCGTGGYKYPVSARELEPNREGTVYRVSNLALQGSDNFMLYDTLSYNPEENQPVSFVLRQPPGADKMDIQSIISVDKEKIMGGKSTVNSDYYEEFILAEQGNYPCRSLDGVIKPFSLWNEAYKSSSLGFIPSSGSFSFCMSPLDLTERRAYLQIEIKDANGSVYASEPVELKDSSSPEIYEQEIEGGKLRCLIYADHAELLSCEGDFRELKIPGKFKGRPLTVIGSAAVSGLWELESLELPDSVEYIAPLAFKSDSNLSRIRLPSGLRVISDWAFYLCRSLREVELPEGLESLGSGAFKFCGSLEKLILPQSLKYIGEGFSDSGSVRSFGGDCRAEGFRIVDGAVLSGDGKTLLACPSAKKFRVPDGVERIGSYSFRGTGIRELILPEGLREIGNCAFQDCPGLRPPQLPDSLETIGFHAFGSHRGQRIFTGSTDSIPVINIGPELRFIGSGAFDGFGARSFAVSGENPRFSSREGHLLNGAGDALIAFSLDGAKDIFMPSGISSFNIEALNFLADNSGGNSLFTLHLPEDAPFLEGDASALPLNIADCTGRVLPAADYIEDLTGKAEFIENIISKTDSGEMRFDIYSGGAVLTGYRGNDSELIIPDTVKGTDVTAIGPSAFENAVSLSSVSLPEKLELIDSRAFSGCTGLTVMHIPAGVRRIGEAAFYDCGSLCSLSFDEGLQKIESSAFFNCSKITGLVFPDSLVSIGDGAFSAASLNSQSPAEELKLGRNISEIGKDAFSGLNISAFAADPGNEYFASPDGFLCTRDSNMLISCPRALTGSVSLPDGIVIIQDGAFANCRGIDELYIPDSVKGIEWLYPIKNISGTGGSYAEEFAQREGLGFRKVS